MTAAARLVTPAARATSAIHALARARRLLVAGPMPSALLRLAPLALLAAVAPAVAACDDTPTADDVDPDATPAPLLEPPPPGAGRQLGLDVTLAPGDELERCQYVVVDEAIEIARFEHAYTTGSHHLLLYQTSLAPDAAPAAPFDCTGAPFSDLGVAGIAYAAQVAGGELAYPDDVALKIPAGAVLLVQTHYLNTSPAQLDAEVRLNLWFTEAPAAVEAGTLFFYDWAIVVPPDAPATAHMRCAVPADVELIFGMSHMHRRGVDYLAVAEPPASAEGDAAPVTLFETTAWQGIEPLRYEPARALAAGSVIDFRCGYQGEADRTVIEGPSANDEMCMFIAAYYPRVDPATELCAAPGSGPVLTGTQSCAATVSCVRGATDPVAAEQCIVDTCAASSQPAVDLMTCLNFACPTACATPGGACDACVLDRCAAPFEACQQASCD